MTGNSRAVCRDKETHVDPARDVLCERRSRLFHREACRFREHQVVAAQFCAARSGKVLARAYCRPSERSVGESLIPLSQQPVALAVQEETRTAWYYRDASRPGSDYRDFDLPDQATAEMCEDLCSDRSGCYSSMAGRTVCHLHLNNLLGGLPRRSTSQIRRMTGTTSQTRHGLTVPTSAPTTATDVEPGPIPKPVISASVRTAGSRTRCRPPSSAARD